MSPLYVVATPIGNLEDITLRALRVLGEVDLIAAEDTRVTRRLLDRYHIRTPMISYHEHNKAVRLPEIMLALRDKDLALVSDAGTPAVNDPGVELVQAAAASGVDVVAIPGPSAVTSAIAVSGVPFDQFIYLGYLPRRRADRQRMLRSLTHERRALLIFETPRRLRSALEDIAAALGERRMAICRELTKLYEEVFRGTASEALAHFGSPRGEFTLVIAGDHEESARPAEESQDVRALLEWLRSGGMRAKEAVDLMAGATGLPRRRVYRMWVESGGAGSKM